MNTASFHLRYEFYFLLHQEIEQNHERFREPRSLSSIQTPYLNQVGLPIDQDKRLFRISALHQAHWLQNLHSSWTFIQRSYIQHFANQGISEEAARSFCSRALLGVILFIKDTDLEQHMVKVPLQGSHDELIFKLSHPLFEVIHTPTDEQKERMLQPATFFSFEPQYPALSTRKWQLQLNLSTPHLAPMEVSTHTINPSLAPNPIFMIFGLMPPGQLTPTQVDWSEQLQHFLVDDEPALLIKILPRLLLRQWQFTRMDLAASLARRHLQTGHQRFFNQMETLSCLSGYDISEKLQEMSQLISESTLLLSQLQQTIKSLEIHRSHLRRWLRQIRNPQWQIKWHYEDEIPLIDPFNIDKQKLDDHITDIESERIHLEGIQQRWRLHFEGRQLAWTERLSSLVPIFAFLVVVGVARLTTVELNHQSTVTEQGSFLSPIIQTVQQLQTYPLIADFLTLLTQPFVYWLLVFVVLLPIFFYLGKMLLKEIHCHRHRQNRETH